MKTNKTNLRPEDREGQPRMTGMARMKRNLCSESAAVPNQPPRHEERRERKGRRPSAPQSSNFLASREDFPRGIGARPLGRFTVRLLMAKSLVLGVFGGGMSKRPKGLKAPLLGYGVAALCSSRLRG